MASQQHDGIKNFHIYYYGGSIATEFDFFAKVAMNLDHNEYKEFKTWVDTREATKNNMPASGSIADLESRRDSLRSQVKALGQESRLQNEIKTYETILAANREAEERKKYPHDFGVHGDLCLFCDME